MSETLPFLRFRLYLGSPHNRDRAARIVAQRFEGFTMIAAEGYWREQTETTTVFEILTPLRDGLEQWNAELTARDLAREFGQESVLLTAEPLPVMQFVRQS